MDRVRYGRSFSALSMAACCSKEILVLFLPVTLVRGRRTETRLPSTCCNNQTNLGRFYRAR